ncbi:MAG: Na+/H+ antiporter subunit G [Steroidobacteraceae bacterium]|nr:Na+/H+ antiporter subunit G [Steroidobacteraceae bacterium]MDW8259108.1 Na+/H+ antiporter subunit G [Gammaproteobacteria bacterium]
MIRDALLACLLLIGAAFTFVGSLGLTRMPDFFLRLHGPTKATTLGLGALVLASLMHAMTSGTGPSAREWVISLFLFITAPVSAYLLGRTALRLRERGRDGAPPI